MGSGIYRLTRVFFKTKNSFFFKFSFDFLQLVTVGGCACKCVIVELFSFENGDNHLETEKDY